MSYSGFQYQANQMYRAPAYAPSDYAQSAANAAATSAYYQTPEGQREQYERALQQQEQQRRQYDSETARQSQEQKYGVLGGLVKQFGGDMAGGSMYDGMASMRRVPLGSPQKPKGFGGPASGMGGRR